MGTSLAEVRPNSQTQSESSLALEDYYPGRDRVREAAARLYRAGYPRRQIAKMMLPHLTPKSKHVKTGDYKRRLAVAKQTLYLWEKEQEFRDLIWNDGVVQLDLKTPAILNAMAKKAIKGNVLAARLALEVTGRHNPKGEQQPTSVAIVFSDMVRPTGFDIRQQEGVEALPQTVDAEVVDGED